MGGRCPARRLRRPLLAGGVVGACPGRQASRCVAAHRRGRTVRRLRHPPGMVDGEALPDAKVVRRELAGVPRIEVVGLSEEKVEELFWDTITQAGAEVAGVPRK